MPSFILIDPTVWPHISVTDRQTGQTDNAPIALGEPFYKRSPNNHMSELHEHFVRHLWPWFDPHMMKMLRISDNDM